MCILAFLSENETIVISLLILAGAACAITVVAVVARHWHRGRVAAYNACLKQLMIERGWSPEEIERVLRAPGQLDLSSLGLPACRAGGAGRAC